MDADQTAYARTSTLDKAELLSRHQLDLAYYWQSRQQETDQEHASEGHASGGPLPEKWQLLRGIKLHDWQRECQEKWFSAGGRGVVKVVTGAGKTVLALAITEKLQNERQQDLRAAIVVPTIVLMDQWYDAFCTFGNLPAHAIARLGGGHKDRFSEDRRILIAVLASASKLLATEVRRAGVGDRLLLVVDECHRAGAEKMSKVFDTQRSYSLGLSATPERLDPSEIDEENTSIQGSIEEISQLTEDSQGEFDVTRLGRALGPIIYELSFAQAIERGVLPRFEIRHYGLPLSDKERTAYERYSRTIAELRKELQNRSGTARSLGGGALVGWARKLARRPTTSMSGAARRYVQQITKRKLLLYRARSRHTAVINLLRAELRANPDSRAILFHERVDEVMRLFNGLRSLGFAAVAENSLLSGQLRAESIRLFRKGIARVLVSARSLIEGFDVPAADVGIVVASSSSIRQRIQTLGRILRKYKTPSGEQKSPVMHVLYLSGTVDEMIYDKTDWASFVGAECNTYYLWDPEGPAAPAEQDGPPRTPPPVESAVEWGSLQAGDIYPGRYEGAEYTCDSMGNVFDLEQRPAENPQGVDGLVSKVKGTLGRFKLTPQRQAILVLVPHEGGWLTRLAGFLEEPFRFHQSSSNGASNGFTTDALIPGDEYPGPVDPKAQILQLKKIRGRWIIAKRVPRGLVFARGGEDASDGNRGQEADKLIEAIQEIETREGIKIRRFKITVGVAVLLHQGRYRFIGRLEHELEFPDEAQGDRP